MSRDPEDIFRSKPPIDLGPLFAHPSTPEATATLRDFAGLPPAPRAVEETQAFDAPTPLSDREMIARIGRIQHELEGPLVDLARLRVDRDEEPGVTAKDAREIAERRGLHTLLGSQQRAWSWLSSWLGRLAREGTLVKFTMHGMVVKRMGDNGNEQVVYLHPYDRRARRAA